MVAMWGDRWVVGKIWRVFLWGGWAVVVEFTQFWYNNCCLKWSISFFFRSWVLGV